MSHLKRITAPTSWGVEKKTAFWSPASSPGPHAKSFSMPLIVIVRDVLKLTDYAREASMVIGSGKVLIDGKKVTDRRFPVGLMDVVSIPEIDERYRMVMDSRGKWRLVRIAPEEAKWKLVRIEGKTTVKGGRTQLNLSDGRNILMKTDRYKTGDVLKVEVPGQKVVSHIAFEKGNLALVISGAHTGRVAKVKEIKVTRDPGTNLVVFEEGFSTVKDNVFIIGGKHPELTLPEEVMK